MVRGEDLVIFAFSTELLVGNIRMYTFCDYLADNMTTTLRSTPLVHMHTPLSANPLTVFCETPPQHDGVSRKILWLLLKVGQRRVLHVKEVCQAGICILRRLCERIPHLLQVAVHRLREARERCLCLGMGRAKGREGKPSSPFTSCEVMSLRGHWRDHGVMSQWWHATLLHKARKTALFAMLWRFTYVYR